MNRRRVVWTALGVAAAGPLVWALRRMDVGDVDPLSAAIGFASFVAGATALLIAVRGDRAQQTDTTRLAARLAAAVRDREQTARRQLLGETGRAIDVQFDFRPAPGHDAAQANRQGRLGDVATYYRKLRPSRMVITGAAGAGKTVLAVELMMMLLQDRAPGDPVPVRLSAASWDAGDEPEGLIRRWLVAHLVEVYRLAPRSARALVTEGWILPVVDGLDELDATDEPGFASRAGQALRVLNAYQHFRERAAVIVTCRSGHYEALVAENSRLEDSARVEIRSVSAAKARDFITSRVVDPRRWRTVLDEIERSRRGPLAAGLSTPWRLTLATVVYEQRQPTGEFVSDPHELTSPSLDTADAVGRRLVNLFIPAALGSTPERPYDPAHARDWLSVLARYLHGNTEEGRSLGGRALSGTDLVLHELWPLAGDRTARLATLPLLIPLWLGLALATIFAVAQNLHPIALAGAATVTAGVVVGVYQAWSLLWPVPWRLQPAALRSPDARGQLLAWCGGGSLAGLAFGLFLVYFGSMPPGFEGWSLIVLFGLAGLAAGALVASLVFGVVVPVDAEESEPRAVPRDDLITAGVVMVGFGVLAAGFIGGLVALFPGPNANPPSETVFSFLVGLFVGNVFALTAHSGAGLSGLRYLALLLCTRRGPHRLPWRLAHFLDTCYRAGILRIAGNAYQFRHRELQDHLARRIDVDN
ncbi:NACHT domain-containing protein [Actinoplanes sp. NPDC023714]|uniref:NACHT domain-containing protein n=1 Tax=Actinoplanes sp. NPDC023714 TaxID=3154322 RepID=UPI0033CDEECD